MVTTDPAAMSHTPFSAVRKDTSHLELDAANL
jgi:hypothetical protein